MKSGGMRWRLYPWVAVVVAWQPPLVYHDRIDRIRLSRAAHDLEDVQGPSALLQVAAERTSLDGTIKFLISLEDGKQVETVLIPPSRSPAANARARSTVCVSSQVGCGQRCTFCATGKMGLVRRLTAEEIAAQVEMAAACCDFRGLPRLANVVLMGMGDPADNAQAVRDAIHRICGGKPRNAGGVCLSRASITISTVAPTVGSFEMLLFGNKGRPDFAADFAGDASTDLTALSCAHHDCGALLAWSLHAADPQLRKRLVPTAKASPQELALALAVALRRRAPKRRRLLVECVLIDGVNDAQEHADAIAALVEPLHAACFQAGRKSKRTGVLVNLIPFNPVAGAGFPGGAAFRAPTRDTVLSFQERLRSWGVWASIRQQRGDDEDAACGQLATISRKQGQKNLEEPVNHHPPPRAPAPVRDYVSAVPMPGSITLEPIGHVQSPYKERFGTPRQAQSNPAFVDPFAKPSDEGVIVLHAGLEHTLRSLEGFSYVWVIAYMHLNTGWSRTIKPPRGPKVKRGVFATRSPHRPAQLALSALRLVKVDEKALTLTVRGLDLLDGTPVLDLKPYLPYCDSFPNASAGWIGDLKDDLNDDGDDIATAAG